MGTEKPSDFDKNQCNRLKNGILIVIFTKIKSIIMITVTIIAWVMFFAFLAGSVMMITRGTDKA